MIGNRPGRVLFLVHNIEAWDSLADVFDQMQAAPDFEPMVATIPCLYHHGSDNSDGEVANHNGLSRLGVPHFRPATGDPEIALDFIKKITPDIIFRQSPWEMDIPTAFGANSLTFARLCYVPYFVGAVVDDFSAGGDRIDLHGDQLLHRLCWRIYAEHEITVQNMRARSSRGGDHIVLSGHPKLDRLWKTRARPAWPIESGTRAFRIVWAPHHSITAGWLGFGTFLRTYRDMLAWAQEDPAIEIVLKPHPALFGRLRGDPTMRPEGLAEFLRAWGVLPNTAIVEGGDYGPLFAGSDAMITDGISFLSEYQIFDKPLVFLDSGHHVPFNRLGEQIIASAWRVGLVADARAFLNDFRRQGMDPTAKSRIATMQLLRPFPGEAAQRIVQDLRVGLGI